MNIGKRAVNVFFLFCSMLFLLIGCSDGISKKNADEKSGITGSVIEDSRENCRLANESDCRPIEIRRGDSESEETVDEIAVAESPDIADKTEENITMQKIINLALACEAGWECIEEKYIAYREANCSWHSLERCVYGCNENENACRTRPICKAKTLKCENDNLMICGEDGYSWLLNKSCDKDCEDSTCTEDLTINENSDIEANASNSITANICDNRCIGINNFHYNAGDDCNNLNNEYVTFKNNCTYPCALTNWNVSDATSHSYLFPSFNLNSQAMVTLYSGNGTDSTTQLYWNSKYTPCPAIWNNGGDTLYLRNSSKDLILTYSYP